MITQKRIDKGFNWQESWNPLKMNCTPIGEGCLHCWVESWKKQFPALKHEGAPELDEYVLCRPYYKKKPTLYAVQYMGDLFHNDVTDFQIGEIFRIILDSPQHRFLVLTKRCKRAAEFVNKWAECNNLDNIWLGFSASTRAEYQKALTHAWELPDAVNKWISIEPLLEEIDLHCYYFPFDWVVVGAESGAKKRECQIGWIARILGYCGVPKVPVFVKQAHIDGKMVKMPTILGRKWKEFPDELQA